MLKKILNSNVKKMAKDIIGAFMFRENELACKSQKCIDYWQEMNSLEGQENCSVLLDIDTTL